MKLKLFAITAAALSLSGLAHADLTGTSSNNGSVSLLVVDITTNNWYIRDTGFTLNQFLPSSVTTLAGDGGVTGNKTPETALTLDKTNTASFADSSFSSWLSAQTGSANIRWMLTSYDNVVDTLAGDNTSRLLVSSSNPSQAISNGAVGNFTGSGAAGGLSSYFGTGTLSKTGLAGNANLSTGFNFGVGTMSSLDQTASLFYAARNTNSSLSGSDKTRFGNTTGFATVSLASNGDFSYVLPGDTPTAVPLPAAAWLLGAGLMGMGGIARRRKAAAKA